MKLSGYSLKAAEFQFLVDSSGAQRLKRLAKTITKCKSKFEWVACIVNDVLRLSVKIHMDIPHYIFFLLLLEAFDPAVSVSHGPLHFSFRQLIPPCGTL